MDQMFVCLVILLSCVNTVVLEIKDICEPLKQNNNKFDLVLEQMPDSIKPDVEHYWELTIDLHFWIMQYNPSTKGFSITNDGPLNDTWPIYDNYFIYMKKVLNAEPKYYWAAYTLDLDVIDTSEMISGNLSDIPNIWLNSDFKPDVIFSPLIDDRKVYNEYVLALQQKQTDNRYVNDVRVYVYENDGLIDKTKEMLDKIPRFIKRLNRTSHVNLIVPLHTLGTYLVIFDKHETPKYCLSGRSDDNRCRGSLKKLLNCSVVETTSTTTVKPMTTSTTTTAKPPMTTTTAKTTKPKPNDDALYIRLILVLCIGIGAMVIVLMVSWFFYCYFKIRKKSGSSAFSR